MSLKHFTNRKLCLWARRWKRPDLIYELQTTCIWALLMYLYCMFELFLYIRFIFWHVFTVSQFFVKDKLQNRRICQLCAFDQDNRLQSPITLILWLDLYSGAIVFLVHVKCSGAHMPGLIVWLWCIPLNPSQKMIYYCTL